MKAPAANDRGCPGTNRPQTRTPRKVHHRPLVVIPVLPPAHVCIRDRRADNILLRRLGVPTTNVERAEAVVAGYVRW